MNFLERVRLQIKKNSNIGASEAHVTLPFNEREDGCRIIRELVNEGHNIVAEAMLESPMFLITIGIETDDRRGEFKQRFARTIDTETGQWVRTQEPAAPLKV